MENIIRVLLIEDDKVDQMAFERLVKDEHLPYDYTIAGAVSEAKEILDSERFDIIIMDYLLGEDTAFDILEDSTIDSPAIFVTGAGDEEVAIRAMKAGAYDYLIKDPERNYLKVLPITVDNAIRHKKIEEERKRVEEERAQLEEQLLQSQKMEAVGRLAGGIAHDFNNLLIAIIGRSECLLMDLDSNHPIREDLEQIQQAGKRAALLTRQLLAFSRKQMLQPEVLDLNDVVTNTDTMLRRLIGEDIELVILLDPALGFVKADRGQLEQAIMNLAVNARDAMPGGGKLTIETMNVELDETYARQHASVQVGPYVMLAVSDTGVGMDKETRRHIFEPFFTTKEVGQGTGLGLSTVYGIVKQSGGHIWCYSEVGRGTTFKIYLPRVGEMAKTLLQRSKSGYLPQGTETVLVVEDEPMVLEMASRVLSRQGYTVLEASNGEEALRVGEQHVGERIDLLLTDVVMPLMGGNELAKTFRGLHPETRVLSTSGYTDNVVVGHGMLDVEVAFLQKPFTPEELAQKVREVLDAS